MFTRGRVDLKRKTPISVISWSIGTLASWSNINDAELKIAENVLRESNTIIIPVKNNVVHKSILADDGSLGIRVPHHSFPIELCKKLGFPITTTSVNRAGKDPLNDPKSFTFRYKVITFVCFDIVLKNTD